QGLRRRAQKEQILACFKGLDEPCVFSPSGGRRSGRPRAVPWWLNHFSSVLLDLWFSAPVLPLERRQRRVVRFSNPTVIEDCQLKILARRCILQGLPKLLEPVPQKLLRSAGGCIRSHQVTPLPIP